MFALLHVSESSCLGLQLKVGGKFHLRLNIGGRPIAKKYREGKMQRTLKRELKKYLKLLKRKRRKPVHCPVILPCPLFLCGLGAVAGRGRGWSGMLHRKGALGWVRLVHVAGVAPDRRRRNGFLYPVLKHGPRSLTYVRV